MNDFNFEEMDIESYQDGGGVPLPPQDGNQDAAWYDTDL